MEGQIRPSIVVSPASVLLRSKSDGAAQQRIVLRGKQPFRVLGVRQMPAGIEVEPGSDRPQVLHVVTVRYRKQDTPVRAAVIQLATDCPEQPLVEIPVQAGSAP